MIYLASPYAHLLKEVREQRYTQVCKAAAQLMGEGHLVFSPIAHSHAIAQHGLLNKPHDFWMSQDAWYMEHCSSCTVLMLPGWGKSKGVRIEIERSTELEKPVNYMEWG